jgi:hypothetical protein
MLAASLRQSGVFPAPKQAFWKFPSQISQLPETAIF